MNVQEAMEDIVNPKKVWSRSEALSKPNPIPAKSGVYAWFFKSVPSDVPLEGCQKEKKKGSLRITNSKKGSASVRWL